MVNVKFSWLCNISVGDTCSHISLHEVIVESIEFIVNFLARHVY